jgi:hypothetical protein
MDKYEYSGEILAALDKKYPCHDCSRKAGMVYVTVCDKFICPRCRKKDFVASTSYYTQVQ